MDKKHIKRSDLDTLAELFDGRVRGPFNDSSKVRAEFTLANGVEATLNLTALLVTRQGTFYGRVDGMTKGWNALRVDTYWANAFHCKGKGSRSAETAALCADILETLTGVKATI